MLIIRIMIYTIAIVSIVAAIALLVYGLMILKEKYLLRKAERQVLETKRYQPVTAPHNHQVIIVAPDGSYITPHLEQSREWAWWNAIQHNKEVKQIENKEVLEPILPKLIQAQRLIIAGGSDAGKTTLVKHIIAGRQASRIIIIDPHSPSHILGYDVIGAGMQWGEIGDALESLILLMQARYEDVKLGTHNYLEHPRVSVFIDEWTDINREVDNAGDMLARLITGSRKVNIHLTFCTHGITLQTLGLPDAMFKRSTTVVELVGGNGEAHRGFIHKQEIDGKRTTRIEYLLPGPFPDYVYPNKESVVKSLPDSKVLKCQILKAQNYSDTAIARMIFNTDKATGPQVKAVQEMLQ